MRQPKPRQKDALLVMEAALFALLLLFFLGFVNRFAGLRSGDGEYTAGNALLAGVLPYRDYFVTAPPLNILKSALLLRLFGTALLVSRIAGVAERLLIAVLLFRWLARLFESRWALVAAFTTMVISSGDHADPLASYNHDAILFAMLAGYTASHVLRLRPGGGQPGRLNRTLGLAVLAGTFAALGLLTKQTTGFAALVLVGFVTGLLLAWLRRSFREIAVWCVGFVAGSILPLAVTAAWLSQHHLLRACLRMLFVTGPTAKATHASQFLSRELTVARGNPVWVAVALVGLLFGWRAMLRGCSMPPVAPARTRDALWFCAGGLLVVGTALAMAFTSVPSLEDFSKTSVYFVIFGLTILLLIPEQMIFRRRPDPRFAELFLLTSLSWTIAVVLSLSWPAFELMTLPGLGVLLAAILTGVRPRARWFPLLVMAAMVFLQIREKLGLPFAFGQQREAGIRFARSRSTQPALRGMRLPNASVDLLDDTARAVASRTAASDTVFTYPEISLVYALTGRYPPTRALSHNIDTVSDGFAQQEAQRLLLAPPAVILYARPSEASLRQEELVWREGRPGGQRKLVAALDLLTSHYRLAGTYVLAPGDAPIRLYIHDEKSQ